MPAILKREHFALYALLTSLTAISIDALLPGLRSIEAQMGASNLFTGHHIITIFIAGMALGELFLGPLSDAIGRKNALLIGLGIYLLGTIIALVAGSLEMVVLGRFLQGAGVAGPKIATRAMIRDQFEGAAMARIMSFMFTLFILIPMLAPLLGQSLLAISGWRGIFALYLGLALCLSFWLSKRQAETLPKARRIPFRPGLLYRNALRILGNRRAALLIAATGLIFGAQLLYLSTAADLFFDIYAIQALFPLYFACLAAGIAIASFLNAKLVQRVGMERMVQSALLAMVLIGLLMLGAAAFWAGRPPLGVFMGLGFAGFFAIGILFGNLNAMTMLGLGKLAGLGASLIASGSSLIAAVFAAGFASFYSETTFYFAAGFLAAALSATALVALSKSGAQAEIEPLRA
ncbi:MAG: MFS transporter [Paracoccaceae bacterium]